MVPSCLLACLPAVAALVISLFPRFPMSTTDNRCHLQVGKRATPTSQRTLFLSLGCSGLAQATRDQNLPRKSPLGPCLVTDRSQTGRPATLPWSPCGAPLSPPRSIVPGAPPYPLGRLLLSWPPVPASPRRPAAVHTQAFRHLYALAAQPRSVDAVDVDTHQPVYVPLDITLAPPPAQPPGAVLARNQPAEQAAGGLTAGGLRPVTSLSKVGWGLGWAWACHPLAGEGGSLMRQGQQ